MTFFEVSAQVLPVLFLALIFDQRALVARHDEGWLEIAGDLLVVVAFAVGEAISLYVLLENKTFTGARQITLTCLAIELVGLILPHVRQRLRDFALQTRWHEAGRWVTAVGVLTSIVAGAVFLSLGLRAASRNGTPASSRPPERIVFEIDADPAIPPSFRAHALRAFGAALTRLVKTDPSRIVIYVRKIGSASGIDTAEVFYAVIEAAEPSATSYQKRVREYSAAQIAAQIATLRIAPDADAITSGSITAEVAVAARLLAAASRKRWLILATDLAPAPKDPPMREIVLTTVKAQILQSCNDSLSQCQIREALWTRYLRRAGVQSLVFLNASQVDLLLR